MRCLAGVRTTMDLRKLEYFVAVAEHRSFTKAADALHVTQPTLSKMVRMLESELGAELFDRSAAPIELTDAGHTILRSARGVLLSLDRMTQELDEVIRLEKGTVRLGIPPMIGVRFFPSAIGKFHSLYPNVHLRIMEQGGKTIETGVDAGDLDVGFVILPVEAEGRFHVHPCIEEQLAVVLPAGHALGGKKELGLGELADEPFILFREDFNLHHVILEECARAGFRPQIAFESSQWDFMAEMVGVGLGITLLPASVCRLLSPDRFRTVALAAPGIPWRMSMIWRKEHYIPFAAREWIRMIRQDPLK